MLLSVLRELTLKKKKTNFYHTPFQFKPDSFKTFVEHLTKYQDTKINNTYDLINVLTVYVINAKGVPTFF